MIKKKEKWEEEEWKGWKIVSEMLDNPDENGIYPTTKCYQKLYEFVVAQKEKAKEEILEKIEGKKWTFIEGKIEMTEKAKRAIIRIHNQELQDLQNKLKEKLKGRLKNK